MSKDNEFPRNPYEVLEPSQRWAPSREDLGEESYRKLLPPLVHKIRKEVKKWRESDYEEASDTSKALLDYWFHRKHYKQEGSKRIEFQYFFAQQEAVESAIYLYEVAEARDKYELMKFDTTGRVSAGMFPESWLRYVIKMATGTGKTKVASLMLAWSYFHSLYEEDSPLSTNFLIISPNIIVLDRLRTDFEDKKIYKQDPIIPENGFRDRDWKKDFQITVHIQDDLSAVSPRGNIYLTNRHRIGVSEDEEPNFEDKDTTEYFLGQKPPSDADRGRGVDLGELLRGDKIQDLVVINDEAHHCRQGTKWFEDIEEISNKMKLKYGHGISLQLDFTATPKDQDGSIFVQTICDYPLVEAIRQNIVKSPVLPDQASRGKLEEKTTDNYVKKHEDYIQLGYEEWKKQYEDLKGSAKIPKLFVMTTKTKQSNQIAEYLENHYPEFEDSVLVIHTKRNGEISEAKSKQDELDRLRGAADDIDKPTSPYKAIVSVLMLREGWDVQTVNTVVGLRPYTSKSRILPEQTIGRGIRKMFGFDTPEELAVIGTDEFIDFVESVKEEGVEFGYRSMGKSEKSNNPIVIEPDEENEDKDLKQLDIKVPQLTPRIYKEYKKLDELNVGSFQFESLQVKKYSAEEQREIVFENLEGEESHRIVLEETSLNYRNVIKFFTKAILKKARLFSGFKELYPKVKSFIADYLFGQTVNLEDPNIIRNLNRIEVKNTIFKTFQKEINELTVTDKGGAEVKNYIKLRNTRPQVVSPQQSMHPDKSVFNRIVGDSKFELEFANFLDNSTDIISYAKNTYNVHFNIEYEGEDGNIHDYYPDFIVKKDHQKKYIVETKGREDLDDLRKIDRLILWCRDASAVDTDYDFFPIYIKEENWEEDKSGIRSFQDVINLCRVKKEYVTR